MNQDEVIACFPSTKFHTQGIAHFHLDEAKCVIAAQIAFNTGVLIVLAVTENNYQKA